MKHNIFNKLNDHKSIVSNRINFFNVRLILCICLSILCLSCQPKSKPCPKPFIFKQHIQELLKDAQKYFKNKQYTKSLKAYETVLNHYKKNSPKRCTCIQLKIAECYKMMNQSKAAESAYKKGLVIAKKYYGQIHEKVAHVIHEMALFYIDQGRYAKAKKSIESALAIDDFIYGPVIAPEKTQHLNTLALIYDHIGAYKKAQAIYQDIYHKLKRKWGVHHLVTEPVINNLGGIYFQQKDYVKAEAFYKEALTTTKKHKNEAPHAFARTLNNIAVLYKTIHEYAQAISFYYSALQINEQTYGPNHIYVGASRNNLAGLYIQTKEYDQALSHLIHAWIIAEMNVHQELLWRVQDNFRDLYAMKNQPDIAIFFGKQAVQTIQEIKSQNTSLSQQLTDSFLKSKGFVFKKLANLLIDQGRLDEAKFFLKMLKEKEFLDFMGHHADRGSSVKRNARDVLNPAEKKMHNEYVNLKKNRIKDVCTFAKELQKTKQKWIELNKQLNQIKIAFSSFCRHLQQEIKETSSDKHISFNNYLKKKNKLQGALSELGHGAIAIYFLKTPNKLSIICSVSSVSFARESMISTKDLNRLIFSFQEKLSYGKSDFLNEAQKLYSLIFGPIESDLIQHDAKIIMVSLDDSLRYIPLSSLHDGKQFVAEKYAISIYTPAASMDIKDKPQNEWRAIAMGVTKALKGFKALPAVQKELDLIIQEDDPLDACGTLPGNVYMDTSFTLDSFQEAVFLQVPVIHIASHFKFQPGDVDTSFLLLGDGQMLTLKMLDENDFDLSHLDLLTLSACETAVSSKKADGKELESFAVMAQNKGAKSVIASLWQVADDSTGLFMEHFYRIHHKNKELTKIEALQKVQQMFIHEQITRTSNGLPTRGGNLSQPTDAPEQREMSYTHPYYWAPFIMIGNWL
ncbi:conserved hypothetical protein, secreted [Candidatus Magnetomorum sp. HK-1]|nr:conserved hypothetical protein, secreted [Candidatus Magnetomorum sp. HK-1]